MAFADHPDQQQPVELLQRSLERSRLAHGLLFIGGSLELLETMAVTLAKVLNCLSPRRADNGEPVDCCDECLNCRKIAHGNHADVLIVRPESKTRVIRIEQITPREGSSGRTLTEFNALKPTEGHYKVGIVVAADRLNESAANAFLKTLEEPSARTVFILLTTAPERMMETIESRCQRLRFAGEARPVLDPPATEWLKQFADTTSNGAAGLMGRYRLLGLLLERLGAMKSSIEEDLRSRSPLEQFPDAEPKQIEAWEKELDAAIEAEYRRQRADVLAGLQLWLRDVWAKTLGTDVVRLELPELTAATTTLAGRIGREPALTNLRVIEQLQRQLSNTNVQESLAFEVSFLKLAV